ncbi:hypothetical protein HOA55_03660 [archaeon]|jgi:hypothetical protein|nr:hypothetical protein [archaeon]MBT3577331.1 hypothetical protein [archaeon]MBT6820425.1 hypothetical protein [archaeon]MBT6956771.1 hypothetical protein [archaeon]MBT7025239.1 hypothetical protein [archaeon]
MGKVFSTRQQKSSTLSMSGLRKNKPQYIIIHSTRKHPEFEDVLNCHKEKEWAGMGYHLFLSDSGILTQGRPFELEGAHAVGFNTNSIGLCIYSSNGSLSPKK